MSKIRLAITGAAGFVGSHVTQQAKQRHTAIDIVDFIDPGTGRTPDITHAEATKRAVAAARADCLLHLAAIAAPGSAQSDPTNAWMTNVIGTLNIAKAIKAVAPETHLIWSGSSESYGQSFNNTAGPIGEDAALAPLGVYGATKAAADIMLRQMMHEGLIATVFRPFNHSGPGQTSDYVMPAFAEQIARIEVGQQPPVLKVGNLDSQRDFLHVSDVVNAYLTAATQRAKAAGKVFNIATGSPVSIDHILNCLLALSSVKVEVEADPARIRPSVVPVASGDNRRLRQDLGWAPANDLDALIADVLAHQRQRVNTS